MSNIEFSFIGLTDYQKAQSLQLDLHQLVKEKSIHAIIGLEHPAVMTLGHRVAASDANDIQELPIVRSTRGGLITIHSEGQLVIYPILDLKTLGWGVKTYVTKLLQTTQRLLAEYQVESFLDEEAIGLYTSKGKIAFCGIQIKNGISLHGISLNVRNDLSLFQNISACGVEKVNLDRLQNYNVNLTLDELFNQWVTQFKSELH
jgi:lipoyl(octanoyl) transferase